MKRIGEIYKKFRFLLMIVPFLALLLPFIAKGCSPRFWEVSVLLTQSPFIAIGHSVRDDESMSGFFTITFLAVFFFVIDQFAALTFGFRGSILACLGFFALMLVIEVGSIEILGWALAKLGQRKD